MFARFGLSVTISREHRSVAQYKVPVPGDLEFTALSSALIVCSLGQLVESAAAVVAAVSWVWLGSNPDEANKDEDGPFLGQLVMVFVTSICITVFVLTAYISLLTGCLGVVVGGRHLCSNDDILVCHILSMY